MTALLVIDRLIKHFDVGKHLKRDFGMSCLFVSHDLNVVRLLCDGMRVMYPGKIVEAGPAAGLFADSKPPYTRAAISAIPQADPEKRVGRLRLSGEPRSAIDPDLNVCRFYGRCPKDEQSCASTMPLLREAQPARQVACHFA